MARKIQRKDLRKPDEFMDVGTKILNWISDHRTTLGISVAAILVVVFGVMLVIHLRRSANVEEWRGLMNAVPVRSMPKGEAPDPTELLGKQEPAEWVDPQRIVAVADGAESESARRLADLAAAGEMLAKGDGASAEQRYRAFLAGNPAPSSAGRLIAQEGLGYALELQKKPDEARQAFAAIAELSDGAYKALALYHQGRLEASEGRDEEARTTLLAAKAVPDPRPTDVVPRIESWLRLLELRSAPPPAPSPPEETPLTAPVPPAPAPEPVAPAPPPVESAEGSEAVAPEAPTGPGESQEAAPESAAAEPAAAEAPSAQEPPAESTSAAEEPAPPPPAAEPGEPQTDAPPAP